MQNEAFFLLFFCVLILSGCTPSGTQIPEPVSFTPEVEIPGTQGQDVQANDTAVEQAIITEPEKFALELNKPVVIKGKRVTLETVYDDGAILLNIDGERKRVELGESISFGGVRFTNNRIVISRV